MTDAPQVLPGVRVSGAYVVDSSSAVATPGEDDTTTVVTTIDASCGCERLEQQVRHFGPGRSAAGGPGAGAEEVLYVVRGAGRLVAGDAEVALEPDLGVHVPAGTGYHMDNPGPDEIVVVAVTVPAARAPGGDAAGVRVRGVRTAERPVEVTGDRRFRRVVDPDTGCRTVTQFVGEIPPGRAPAHSHTYDEVVYVLAGQGVIHAGDEEHPLRPGTCVHLPPPLPHCLENTGDGTLRVLGVFHPAGSPAMKQQE